MREMHKWKDKIEFSLDNRQIFFLFFGLSVVGCFVFALGVMTGRRIDLGGSGEEVMAQAADGLELLDGVGSASDPGALTFKDGLKDPATEGLPQTRDPDAPLPAAQEGAKDGAAAEPAAIAADATGPAKPTKPTGAEAGKSVKGKGKGKNEGADNAGKSGAVLSGSAKELKSEAKPGDKQFTLQMKAFSRREDADSFAAPLRANGHDVRVEAHEIKGRIWHRVRVGVFDDWTDGLAAKEEFEKAEKLIAYVVRL